MHTENGEEGSGYETMWPVNCDMPDRREHGVRSNENHDGRRLEIAEVVFPDRTNSDPQPSLIIFTRGSYSRLSIEGRATRPQVARPQDPRNPTDAEKIALYEHWRPFTATAGTYAIRGSTLVLDSVVAKNAEVMDRSAPSNWEIKPDVPNTSWLIPSPDRMASEPRMKLLRLE